VPTPSRHQIAEPALGDDGQQLADDGHQWADEGSSQRMTVWTQMMENVRITMVRAR